MGLVIYEMILRDGLQSLKKIYSVEEKFLIYKLIKEIGILNIEFGSMTSEKILPQMSGSLELYNKIVLDDDSDNKSNLIMLCPSIGKLEKSFNANIKNISLLCSCSEQFSIKNLNCSKEKSYKNMWTQLEYLIKKDYEQIRIYISCVFGSPWDIFDKSYLKEIINIIDSIYTIIVSNNIDYNKFDIVLSDTFGLGNINLMKILYMEIKKKFDQDIFGYIGLHLHTNQIIIRENYIEYNKSVGFEELIKTSLDYGIKKYDSSILGIGGCPFGEDNLKGNLSTLDLYRFLDSIGYDCDIDIKKLEQNSFEIKKILDN